MNLLTLQRPFIVAESALILNSSTTQPLNPQPVLPYALVVGNPAKQIRWMSEYGHRLNFDKNGKAVCEESGDEYELKDNKVKKIKAKVKV